MKIYLMTWALSVVTVLVPAYGSNEGKATLDKMIEQAIADDYGLRQLHSKVSSLQETAIASASLMDPTIKFGVGGLPVDSFQLDDDGMTNIAIGVAQKFSRGDSLTLSKQGYEQQAEGVEYQVQQRKLDIAKSLTSLWIELRYFTRVNDLTSEMQTLMQEMVAFVETNYSLGKNDTQDLLYAELQVSQLDEALQKNRQMQQGIRAKLSEWVTPDLVEQIPVRDGLATHWNALSAIEGGNSSLSGRFYSLLNQHPKVQAAEQAIRVQQTQTDIVEQTYSPQFGVELGYAYRQAEDATGSEMSDLLSVYLTMDVPLFTDKRQDRRYKAAQHQAEMARSAKDLLLVRMNAKVNTLLADKQNLEDRLQRYQQRLVKQASERTKATERGYQNNTAQLSDLILAVRDELMILQEEARLTADLDQTHNELAYTLNRYDWNLSELSTSDDVQEAK